MRFRTTSAAAVFSATASPKFIGALILLLVCIVLSCCSSSRLQLSGLSLSLHTKLWDPPHYDVGITRVAPSNSRLLAPRKMVPMTTVAQVPQLVKEPVQPFVCFVMAKTKAWMSGLLLMCEMVTYCQVAAATL